MSVITFYKFQICTSFSFTEIIISLISLPVLPELWFESLQPSTAATRSSRLPPLSPATAVQSSWHGLIYFSSSNHTVSMSDFTTRELLSLVGSIFGPDNFFPQHEFFHFSVIYDPITLLICHK